MQDEEKNAEINTVFAERHPELVKTKNTITYRSAIAHELFEAEDKEIKVEFRLKAEEDHKEAMEEYKGGVDGNPDLEDDERANT
jgi:hypothetical protein